MLYLSRAPGFISSSSVAFVLTSLTEWKAVESERVVLSKRIIQATKDKQRIVVCELRRLLVGVNRHLGGLIGLNIEVSEHVFPQRAIWVAVHSLNSSVELFFGPASNEKITCRRIAAT